MTPTRSLYVRIPNGMHDRIVRLATEHGTTLSQTVSIMLAVALGDPPFASQLAADLDWLREANRHLPTASAAELAAGDTP